MSAIKYPPAYQRFWMAFEVSSTKLRVFRFAFFALFALDAWLQIAHAPRYGANNFNVAHFPLFDFATPMPTRAMMLIVFGLQAYLGIRIALGGVSRGLYIAAAVAFALGYYISQLNSLQHHYLLSIALCLIAAFPWPDLSKAALKKAKPNPKEQRLAREKNWPIRMLLMSLSVMYFFAAMSKLNPLWIDGTTLKLEISAEWMRDTCDWVGWSTMAWITIVTELALALLIHLRRAWPLTILIGLSMHMAFEFSGLDIGLFSYFMVTIYLLLLPETWLQKLSSLCTPRHSAVAAFFAKANAKRLYAAIAFGFALAATLPVTYLFPFPVDTLTTLLLLCTVLAAADFALRRQGASAVFAHLAAVFSLVLFLHTTDAVRDYYRFWGGQERRSGNITEAIIAYEDLVRFEPSYAQGHRRLGDLYRQVKRREEALVEYQAGLELDSKDFALNKAAAQLYHELGRGPEALQSAERALEAKSGDPTARRIRDHWLKQKTRSNAKRP